MGRELHDWDVEVHGLHAQALERALRPLGSVSLVGKSFGVYKLRPPNWTDAEIDVSIPRRDSKVGPGHRGISAEGDPHLGVREAARRRDLTVNAVMIDLGSGELVDPWDGVRDVERGLLRAVDRDTFLEDPLRALRVVQFAARLEFEVDPTLIALCGEAALDELPAERILGEWAKLLLQARRPSLGLQVARRAAILERVFPELPDQPDVDAIVDRMVPFRDIEDLDGRRLAWMLAVWLHRCSPEQATATLDRLGVYRFLGFDARPTAVALVAHHSDPIDTDADLRWLSTRAEVAGVLALTEARTGRDTSPQKARAAALGVLYDKPPPLLQGRHLKPLGIAPGPHMGEILREVYAAQLDGTVTTLDQAKALATS